MTVYDLVGYIMDDSQVEIYMLEEGKTVFSGDVSDIPWNLTELEVASINPEENAIVINIQGNEQFPFFLPYRKEYKIMKLTVRYDIKDIFNHCQTIAAEKYVTKEDFPIVKDVIRKMDKLYSTISAYAFLTDGEYFLRIYYESFLGVEHNELTVQLVKLTKGYLEDVRWEDKMPRAKVYKLVKKALETGLNEDWGI